MDKLEEEKLKYGDFYLTLRWLNDV